MGEKFVEQKFFSHEIFRSIKFSPALEIFLTFVQRKVLSIFEILYSKISFTYHWKGVFVKEHAKEECGTPQYDIITVENMYWWGLGFSFFQQKF